MRFVIIAHFLYLWQSFKRVTFFIFSKFPSQIYPLQICHSKNLMPNLALKFSHIFQKSVFFFRSTFGKSSNYLEGTKIAIFNGERLDWMTPVSRKMNFSPLYYPKTTQFYWGYPTMFSLLGQHQISMRRSCLTKTLWFIMVIFVYLGLFLTVQMKFGQCPKSRKERLVYCKIWNRSLKKQIQ